MISLRNVSLSYGSQVLFEGASLQINEGDRLALVGPNGSGKSTIFRMLLGETKPDEGKFEIKRGIRVGYLPQENAPVSERSVLVEVLEGQDPHDNRAEAKAKSILDGLGFRQSDFDKPVRELSGGWAMRVAMARLLVQEPDMLLLDEPTNHLDLWSLLWFRDYLLGYPGTIFVISHDREFINTVCYSIVSVQEHVLKVYPGNYEHFVSEYAEEKRRRESAFKLQQAKLDQMQEFVNRNKARLSTARRAQSMMKKIEKVDRIELTPESKRLEIRLPQPGRSGKEVVQLKGLGKSYGDTVVYRNLDFTIQRGWRMAFVGPNGAGKSTLLKILAGVLPFESGEMIPGHNVVVGYHSQHRVTSMNSESTVLEEALGGSREKSQEVVRTLLGSFLFPGDAVFKKIRYLSGGEKSRLSLLKFLLDPPSFLLLDEPTTHLDMDAVSSLIDALKGYEGTLAFISHDLHFINSLADHVVRIEGGKVDVYPGNFELYQWRQKKAQG